MKVYNAYSPSQISRWGTLRYFEEVKTPQIGKTKANQLLNLYCNKTRELKVKGAFGDIGIRAGTLIPIQLDLGDVSTNNYMLVEKVTHTFNYNRHEMDLTLVGAYEKDNYTVDYTEAGVVKETSKVTNTTDITTINRTSGNAKADYILNTLVSNGATVAGACGVLANVEAESNFNTTPHTGDGGKASGICQWHPDRWKNLQTHCMSKKLSSTSIEGQTSFMIYELKQYPSLWSGICKYSGKQGAKDVAYSMCVNYERPANKEKQGKYRETLAEKWWGIYGHSGRGGKF
jgi:hypothetical protein